MPNTTLRNVLSKYYEIITLFGESISYLFLYSIGICRYRVILYLAAAGIIKAIINSTKIGKNILNIILITFALPFLYVDIQKGQLYPIYNNLNVLISLGAMLITAFTVNKYLKTLVQKITDNEVFTYCLNCKFENSHLVKRCVNCKSTVMDFCNADVNLERPMSLLNCIAGEHVVAVYSFGGFQVYKDNIKLQVKQMIITNINTVLVNYKMHCKGWSNREVINNTDIIKIAIENAKYNKRAPASILLITTSIGTIYELFHYSTDPAPISLTEIANCLKSQNAGIEIDCQNLG